MMVSQQLKAVLILANNLTFCTFNFELTSQRTALENQVMGSYKEIDDELVLISAIRGANETNSNNLTGKKIDSAREQALLARQNQDFNRDDIDEYKTLGLIGESNNGLLTKLKQGSSASISDNLVDTLVNEENKDREFIWSHIIASNKNLTVKDLPEVRRTYAKMQWERAQSGDLLQDDQAHWIKKSQGIDK